MLSGRPWLRGAEMAYDWENNIVTIQRNAIVRTIIVTKHLRGEVRRLEMLLFYDYLNDIIDEKEDTILL
jgi:hypothetical protein